MNKDLKIKIRESMYVWKDMLTRERFSAFVETVISDVENKLKKENNGKV